MCYFVLTTRVMLLLQLDPILSGKVTIFQSVGISTAVYAGVMVEYQNQEKNKQKHFSKQVHLMKLKIFSQTYITEFENSELYSVYLEKSRFY